jgi:hypothetical protein
MAAAGYHTLREGKTDHILFLSAYADTHEVRKRLEEVAGRVWIDARSKYERVPIRD